jgi:N-acetylneuraminic acid mutarotase
VPVPAGTDLASLTPNIQVGDPECHALSPPSGQPQDFTVPVFYEVQNEAGSMNSYEVSVNFKQAEATRFSDDSIAIQWTTGSDMPVPSGWGSSVVLDNKIYVIGGGTDNRVLVEKLQVYDPVTDQWDLSKSTPLYPRYAQGACTVNGKIYVFGGAIEYPGPVYDNIQVYDPETNKWKDHGTMTSPRDAFSTVAYDGKIYLLGGGTNEPSSNAEILDLVEVYDPEVNSWETLAPMPSPRAYFSACVVNGKIYAIGGIHKFPFPGLTTIFEYDPASDTWEVKQPMLKGRYLPSTCVVDGKIFCIGGNPLDLAADGSTAVEVYDPARDSVYQATDIKYLRYGAASGVVNDKIYILGGCNDAHYNTYCSKTEIGVPEID